MMAHVDQHVSVACEVFHCWKWPAIAGIDERLASVLQPKRQGHQIRLEMPGVTNLDRPFPFCNLVADFDLLDDRIRTPSRENTAARLVNGKAAAMPGACDKIRIEDPAIAK